MNLLDGIKVTEDRRMPVLSAVSTEQTLPEPHRYNIVYKARLVIEREHVIHEFDLMKSNQREIEHMIRAKMRRSINRTIYSEMLPLLDDLLHQIELDSQDGARRVIAGIFHMMDLNG